MPPPVLEPSPSLPATRFGAPAEAQETSYFAASARMRSLASSFASMQEASGRVANVHVMFYNEAWQSPRERGRPRPLLKRYGFRMWRSLADNSGYHHDPRVFLAMMRCKSGQ